MGKSKYYLDRKGYWRFSDTKKRVHIAVMEKILGMPIPKGKVVHHINENKKDNRPENLQLMTSKEHRKHHRIRRKKVSLWQRIVKAIKILLGE